MIRVFIGYDPREAIAFDVLAKSIWRRASMPVSITPLIRANLPVTRAGGSTEFAFSRFLVPWLCGYDGHAIFMDCDMLCQGDIAELWNKREPVYRWHGPAVKVVQQDYRPTEAVKFLGQEQTSYERKNWSSVMLFDCGKCRTLTPEYVDNAPGLDLHQLKWAQNVGSLPAEWNYLVGQTYNPIIVNPKLIHYTVGGPWFPEYRECEFAEQWFQERDG